MHKILTPIKLGNMELKNRLMYLAMVKRLSTSDNFITDRQIAYYVNYAKNGVGLISTGACIIDNNYPSQFRNQPGLYDDKFLPGLKKLTDAVHAVDGKIFFQLWHPGESPNNCKPSEVKKCADWTKTEIHNIIEMYAEAALRAKKAGADGVEFHMAHNFLPGQFIVPYFNKRTDEYSAETLENGLRFSIESIRRIKKACGSNFPVTVKMNGMDVVEGGMTPEYAAEAILLLEKEGVLMVAVNAGGPLTDLTAMSGDGYRKEGWKVPYAAIIKKKVNIPVMAMGNIRHPKFIEKILQDGSCDMVGMGRGLLADPEWIKKLSEGREDEIKACISCMVCFKEVNPGESNCSINPLALRESENIVIEEDGDNRTVVVVGSGPAGLEAAITLAKRKFKPIIFESKSYIGGNEKLAAIPIKKSKFNWHIKYFKKQLEKLNIEVRLDTSCTPEILEEIKPYAVFVATGSIPVFPESIPGITKSNVKMLRNILEDFPNITGKKIVVIGADLPALETATTFAVNDNFVTVIDRLPEPPATIGIDHKLAISHALKSKVDIKMSHKLVEIKDHEVIAENMETNQIINIPADMVVISMGVQPDNVLYNQIKDKFEHVINIGDSNHCGKIVDAVQASFDKAVELK